MYQPIPSGLAQVIQPQMPPMAEMLDKYERRQHEQMASQQKRRDDQIRDNSKNLDELFKYQPQAALSQFDEETQAMVSDYYNFGTSIYKGAESPTAEQRKELAQRKYAIEGRLNKVREYKSKIDNLLSIAEKDKSGEFDTKALYNRLYSTIQNKGIDDLDMEDLDNIARSPDVYFGDKVIKNFADTIPESIDSFIEENSDPSRPYRDKIQVKSKFLALDDSFEPMYDENGRPILNITPTLLNMAKKNERVNLQIQAETERLGEGATELQALENLLSSYGYSSINRTRASASVRDVDGSGSSGSGTSQENALERRRWLERAVGLNGDPDATQLGKFIGGSVQSVKYKIDGRYVDPADISDISKSFGERTLGTYRKQPTAIVLEIPDGEDIRGNQKFKQQEFPIATVEDKEKTIRALNNLANKLSDSKSKVSLEEIDQINDPLGIGETDDILDIL